MENQVTIALISMGSSISTAIIALLGNYLINSKKEAVKEQRQNDRLESIERKLDEHNHYAEKLGNVDINLAKLSKDVEYLKERITHG